MEPLGIVAVIVVGTTCFARLFLGWWAARERQQMLKEQNDNTVRDVE